MRRTIQVFISPEGETKIETLGFSGNQCQQASAFLEQALGTRQSETLKREYYQTEVQAQQQHQSNP